MRSSADLRKAEKLAIEAVARHLSAAWQQGDSPPDAYLTVGGRRIALDVAVVAPQPSGRGPVTRARLREDRVAQRTLREIESALGTHVPDGKTIVFTLGAPIKVPAQLIAALTSKLLIDLASGAEEVDEKETILGNRIRYRVLDDRSTWNQEVIGFVFSGDPEPGFLASAMRALHDEIAAKAKARLPEGFAGERWLVLSSDRWFADVKTYRRAYSLLSPTADFKKIMMVLDGGRVEVLAEG